MRLAFEHVGLDWEKYVVQRPGASSARPRWTCWSATRRKARDELGWEPTVDFEELVRMMVDADLERVGSRWPAGRSGSPAR